MKFDSPIFSLRALVGSQIPIVVLLILLAGNLSAQSQRAYRQPASEKSIPKLVLNTMHEQYPDAIIQGWYVTHITYWQNDISAGWYNEWYGTRNVVAYTYSKPSYYEVEFLNKFGEKSRAIYNLYGYWFETRSQLKGLPLAIHEALKVSEYKDWKVSALKERIETPAWPMDIYRFQVAKGLRAEILRMDEKGEMIQKKQLKN